MIDVHANNRDIPAGKILLCEYRDIQPEDPRAIPQVLETGRDTFGRHVSLEAIPAGWAIAGSMLRWDNGCFRVAMVDRDGILHGRRFKAESDARDLFAKWTKVETA